MGKDKIILVGYDSNGMPYGEPKEYEHGIRYWKDGKWHGEGIENGKLTVVDGE